MARPIRSSYTHLVIHPLNEDGAHEAWASFTETHPQLGTFETDGLIGWVYPLANGYVWLNEAGHPTMLFTARDDLIGWLQTLAPSMDWPV